MSSFFTAPASQKKRKRIEGSTNNSTKRRSLAPTNRKPQSSAKESSREPRDESISGSDSEASDPGTEELPENEDSDAISSEDETETAAEKRLRIAERYLENLQEEIDPAGFDAAEIDRDRIAERLREDVAESKGKIYRHISNQLAFSTAQHITFRSDQLSPTGIASAGNYAYTVAKDITLCKWELPQKPITNGHISTNITPRRKPKLLKKFTGNRNRTKDPKYMGHTAPILCIAASASGKYLATGGSDKRLVIWDAESLKPVKVFYQHRDSVLSVSFRRNSHTLFSASADRTIKIWSLDEMTYIETLFGHQDQIVDIVGLSQEMCVSVGSRDRTARLWKVVEESQLVFRGGGGGTKGADADEIVYTEGSIERVAMLDDDMFVTGSDNGSISLWNVQRKKPVDSVALAHGTDPIPTPAEISADIDPDPHVDGRPKARWITALATIPYSDLILSGSWDGYVRVWRVSEDKRRLESVGAVSSNHELPNTTSLDVEVNANAEENHGPARGIITDLSVYEVGDRGKDGLHILASVSKQHRLGKWSQVKNARNGAVLFEVTKSTLATLDPSLQTLPILNGH